jgi:hypothetical protein
MHTQNYDDWTVERWRTEPQWRALEFDEKASPDSGPAEQAPPFWKDFAWASVVGLLLWLAAVALLW